MPTHKSVLLHHRGGMAYHAEPSSGHPMDFDDRQSNTGASPVETVLSALGACTAMDIAGILAKKRQDVTAYRILVTGLQRDEYPQVYTDVTVTHEVDGRDIAEAAVRRAIELSALKYCPVNAMLSAGATTVQMKLATGFGTAKQKEQTVTLRLKNRQEVVYVGEFEVAAD